MERGRLITYGGLAFCGMGLVSTLGAMIAALSGSWIRLSGVGFGGSGTLSAQDEALVRGLLLGSAALCVASGFALVLGVAVSLLGLRQRRAQARTSTLVVTLGMAVITLPFDGFLLWLTFTGAL